MVESTTVTHSSADWWNIYFPWHRHQKGPTTFSVSSERHWQSGVNEIANFRSEVFRSGIRTWPGPPGRQSKPINALTHSVTGLREHAIINVWWSVQSNEFKTRSIIIIGRVGLHGEKNKRRTFLSCKAYTEHTAIWLHVHELHIIQRAENEALLGNRVTGLCCAFLINNTRQIIPWQTGNKEGFEPGLTWLRVR